MKHGRSHIMDFWSALIVYCLSINLLTDITRNMFILTMALLRLSCLPSDLHGLKSRHFCAFGVVWSASDSVVG